jgi:hypothetical protein
MTDAASLGAAEGFDFFPKIVVEFDVLQSK